MCMDVSLFLCLSVCLSFSLSLSYTYSTHPYTHTGENTDGEVDWRQILVNAMFQTVSLLRRCAFACVCLCVCVCVCVLPRDTDCRGVANKTVSPLLLFCTCTRPRQVRLFSGSVGLPLQVQGAVLIYVAVILLASINRTILSRLIASLTWSSPIWRCKERILNRVNMDAFFRKNWRRQIHFAIKRWQQCAFDWTN
jgi:hypothetical protein